MDAWIQTYFVALEHALRKDSTAVTDAKSPEDCCRFASRVADQAEKDVKDYADRMESRKRIAVSTSRG